jgi:hypothetical protein
MRPPTRPAGAERRCLFSPPNRLPPHNEDETALKGGQFRFVLRSPEKPVFPFHLHRSRGPGKQQALLPQTYRERETAMSKTFDKDQLRHFTGSEHWYRHGINRKVTFTDGAKYVADTAGAYWLLDEIAIIQPYEKSVAAEEFQVWTLKVRENHTATLTCEDGNRHVVFTKEIEFTDFPSDEITLWFANNTIFLPSEY